MSGVAAGLQVEFAKVLALLNNLARAAVRFVEAEARQNGVTMTLVLASELPEVVVDTIQIEQVILNLLVNAMEGIPVDKRVLTVQTTKREQGRVELTVSDTGPGLSDDTIGRMFDAFFTTKPHGMGMGLSISRSIVEAHKGRLWAEAPRDEGAMLHLILPSTREEVPVQRWPEGTREA